MYAVGLVKQLQTVVMCSSASAEIDAHRTYNMYARIQLAECLKC